MWGKTTKQRKAAIRRNATIARRKRISAAHAKVTQRYAPARPPLPKRWFGVRFAP